MKIILKEEGVINSLISLPFRALKASFLRNLLDRYYSSRRFSFKSTDLKLWRYLLLSWIPEPEHQIGRLMNMDKIFRSLSEGEIEGDIIEFGSYQGLSIVWMAKLREKYNLRNRKIIAVDSFEGLPKSSTVWVKGQMSNTSLKTIKANLFKYLTPSQRRNIFIIKGLFSNTKTQKKITSLLDKGICLSHIDCDLGSSCTDALNIIFRHLNKSERLFLLFDDWGCSPDEIPQSWNKFSRKKSGFSIIELSTTNLTKYFYIHK